MRRPNKFRLSFSELTMRLVLLALGLLLVQAPMAHGQSGTVHFAVIGDYGLSGQSEADVASLVKSWNPDFVITVGDNNYYDGAASTIDTNIGQYYHSFIYPYLGSYGAGANINRFFPAPGNHDWNSTRGYQPYRDFFTLPNNERYYEQVWGPVDLLAINSDTNEPDGITSTSVQAAWLQNHLAASSAPWKLVYFHHPPYTSASNWVAYMQWPFQAWGASAVLSGHAHVYERLSVTGFPYLINGLGGEGIDSFWTPSPYSVVRYNSDYGALLVTASADQITFQFTTRTGLLIDSYSQSALLPAAPSSLTATAVSSTQLFLSWNNNSSIETGFTVERSTDGVSFTQVGTAGANSTGYLDSGLSPQTMCYYRVSASNTRGSSASSNVASATTLPTSPDAPSNLTATLASSNQINLAWIDNSNGQEGFQVERCTDGVSFTLVATVGANQTSYSDTGLMGATHYYYRVRGTSSSGNSAYSNVTSAATVLPAPSNLSATAVSTSQINLTWTDNSSNQDSVMIERSSDGLSFAQLGTVGANGTSYPDTGLIPGTTYYYRVRAYHSGLYSAYSDPASATTFAPPAAPSNLVATAASSSQINLTWTDNSSNEDGFKLYLSTDGVNYSNIKILAANTTSYSDTGRSPGTIYYYQVLAYTNAGGNSPYSNTASATTTK